MNRPWSCRSACGISRSKAFDGDVDCVRFAHPELACEHNPPLFPIQVFPDSAKQAIEILMPLSMQVGETQKSKGVNAKDLCELVNLLQGGASQSSLDQADIRATGYVGETLLGHSFCQSEFFKALGEGLLGVHGVIPLCRDDQLNALNTIALQTIVFI